MPSIEVLVWILGGACVVISAMIGVIWTWVREEARKQDQLIELKANDTRLTELDARFERELTAMREGNEKLVEKLQQRHDRDLDTLSTGFKDQIAGIKEQMSSMERNILQQLAIMFGNNK